MVPMQIGKDGWSKVNWSSGECWWPGEGCAQKMGHARGFSPNGHLCSLFGH